jgi:hypothetical protein
MITVVFLGPSLPLDDARAILPDAIFLPPARQADLMSAVGTYRPDAIALIDGEFGQSMSVWHKEILFALWRGVHVFGASSMGALRASELDGFGMQGVGTIYAQFADGTLTDDDEVAVAHARADGDFVLLSEPMVNLRATIAHAVATSALTPTQADVLLRAAKIRHYPERSLTQMVRDALLTAPDIGTEDALLQTVRQHYVDAKAHDARTVLRHLAALPPLLAPPRDPVPVAQSSTYVCMYERDRTVRHADVDVPLADVANYAALHFTDFHEINQHALNRALVNVLAEMLHVTVDAEETRDETARFRLRHRLFAEDDLHTWCRTHHLFEDEFETLMREAAVQRKLQRWMLARRHFRRSTTLVLNELRHAGRYHDAVAGAAGIELLLQNAGPTLDHIDHEQLPVERVFVDHMRATGMRADTASAAWALDAGFHTVEDLRIELLRVRAARAAALQSALAALSSEQAPIDTPDAAARDAVAQDA